LYIIVYSESFWKTLWGEFSPLIMILTRVYIFLSRVQIHTVGTLHFRFAKLKADHFAHMAKSTMQKKVALSEAMHCHAWMIKLKTVSIPVCLLPWQLQMYVWLIWQQYMYYIGYIFSCVVLTGNKYCNHLKQRFHPTWSQ
jgi:hypothetical protein